MSKCIEINGASGKYKREFTCEMSLDETDEEIEALIKFLRNMDCCSWAQELADIIENK